MRLTSLLLDPTLVVEVSVCSTKDPGRNWKVQFSSVQSLSRVQLFSDPMNRSTPGLSVHHQLLGVYSNSCPSSW